MPRLSPMPNAATAITDAPTLPALLARRIARSPGGEAYRAFDTAMQRSGGRSPGFKPATA
jgi:hypothetical protein